MVRDHEVVGSNPVASTSKKSYFASKIALFLFKKIEYLVKCAWKLFTSLLVQDK